MTVAELIEKLKAMPQQATAVYPDCGGEEQEITDAEAQYEMGYRDESDMDLVSVLLS